ncbi:MAG TPA: GNAT family N-acetyltransferase [Chloroflexi bacterium]|nr:GNAT family N-acetyltransferase [Chloroflexota bacterium]
MDHGSCTDSAETPYRQPLGDGLLLCAAADEGDVGRVAEFNGIIHGPETAMMTRNLFTYHPNTQGKDLIFVEDEHSGQVVSSLCLIPWTWRYEGVEIPAGEMGIVGTLEAYRRRGLVRAQVGYFKRRLRERGCLISHIQGIPYYYRQFGYEYALPLEGGLRLETRCVPDPPGVLLTFRLATRDDLPALMRLYDEASQDLAIHAVRDEATWRYLLTYTDGTETEHETWIIQDTDRQVVAYMRLPEHHFGEELVVDEVSRLRFETALAVLHHLKTLAVERQKPGIRLNLPAGCTLLRLARSLGGHDLGTYAWQIHVPDFAALLRMLGPVLERRIAESPFVGLTRDLRLSLYRETLLLRFVAGRLTEVVNLGFTGDEPLRFPPLSFIPLLLGYRMWEELRATHPDVNVAPAWRLLTDTLFPRVASFIYTIY